MKEIRGLLYFDGKSYKEVVDCFKDNKIQALEFAFFRSLFIENELKDVSGMFISGYFDDEMTPEDIIIKIRDEIGLAAEVTDCDISAEDDDEIIAIREGEYLGNYIGIRINPPFDIDNIKDLSQKIADIIGAEQVFIRTVEEDEKNKDRRVCLDFLTKEDFAPHREEVENEISQRDLELHSYTLTRLE